jgi:hypothetical protein
VKGRPARAFAWFAGAVLFLSFPQTGAAQNADAEDVAGFESAGALLRKCRENSSFSRSYCFAYLAAVADSARAYRVWIGSGDPCLPGGLTLGKLADTFEAYLVANPSLTEAQAASVIVASLQEAYACAVPAPAPAPTATPVAPSQERPGGEVDDDPQQDGNS